MVREMGTRDMRHKHDVLPEHFFENPSPATGAPPLDRDKFDSLMNMYYELKGWDKDGLPTRSKLEELDIYLHPTPNINASASDFGKDFIIINRGLWQTIRDENQRKFILNNMFIWQYQKQVINMEQCKMQ